MVGLDDQQGCGGFETYSSLDADYGVSYVNVPANTVRSREGIQAADSVRGLVKLFFINAFQFSFFEMKGNVFGPVLTDWSRKGIPGQVRSEEHTSELQSLMRNSYAVFCLKK